MKRNQVKQHDNILRLLQLREEDRAQEIVKMQMLKDIRDELRILVNIF